MRINFGRKENKEERQKRSRERRSWKLPRMSFAKVDADKDVTDFAVSVRLSEPIMKLGDASEQYAWRKNLFLNIACAMVLLAASGFFCFTIYEPGLILSCLPCFVVFMLMTTLEDALPGRAKLIAAAACALALIAGAVIFRGIIFGGLGMLVDRFYDVAEEAQAYIYERPSIKGNDTEAAGRIGLVWVSAFVGYIASLPPARMRRGVCVAVTIIVMLAFAYYGLVPSAICAAIMAAALMMAASRGSLLPALPIMLIVLILFGAIMLINPGENIAISRADENMRDRFAMRSALIKGPDDMQDDQGMDEWSFEDPEDPESRFDRETVFDGEYGTFAVAGVLALLAASIGAAAYLIHKYLSRRREENRRNIDSSDAKEAVTAMFPYALKWLRGLGIEQTDMAVTSMIPALKETFSTEYSDRFADMYTIWSEAAYSDHPVTEDARLLMEGFMNDTIEQTKKKCKLKDRLRFSFRYAL